MNKCVYIIGLAYCFLATAIPPADHVVVSLPKPMRPQHEQPKSTLEQVRELLEKDDLLMEGIKEGNLQKVESALAAGASSNVCNEDGDSALLLACKSYREDHDEVYKDIIVALFEKGATLDVANKQGVKPLLYAAATGKVKLVKLLLQSCTPEQMNEPNEFGVTPIIAALLPFEGVDTQRDARREIVYEFLRRGVDITLNPFEKTIFEMCKERGYSGVFSLIIEAANKKFLTAYENNDYEGMERALKHGARLDCMDDVEPLLYAAFKENDLRSAEFLIQHGAAYVLDGNGPVLHTMIKNACQSQVEFLIEHLPNVNKSVAGKKPLALAIEHRREELIEPLLERGAHVDTARQAHILLEWAMRNNKDRVRQLLIKQGVANLRNEDGTTLFTHALKTGDQERADLFIQSPEVDKNGRDGLGDTPLIVALKMRTSQSTELINHGARLDVPTPNGTMPLHLAAVAGTVELVDFMLKNGAALDAKNGDGRTALMAAAYAGRTRIIEFLLEQGACYDTVDTHGLNFFDYLKRAESEHHRTGLVAAFSRFIEEREKRERSHSLSDNVRKLWRMAAKPQ